MRRASSATMSTKGGRGAFTKLTRMRKTNCASKKNMILLQPYFQQFSSKSSASALSSTFTSQESSRADYDDRDADYQEEHEGNTIEENDPLSDEYALWSKAVNKAVKALTKKQNSLESEWEKAQGVEATVSRAQLIVSNLYLFTPRVTSATVQDWENDGAEVELTLDPKYDSASAEADALFARARKLKRGSKIIGDLLEQNQVALNTLEEARADLRSAQSEEGGTDIINEGRFLLVQDRLKRSSKVTKFQIPVATRDDSSPSPRSKKGKPKVGDPASNLRKLTSPGGLPVLVGRNRRGNEYLSMVLAKGQDIWMHARGSPGAHVLVQVRRGGPQPTRKCLQYAADLAAFYSDARSEAKTVITLAEPKHIQKPKGAPLGAVKIREELNSLIGRPENVPESLKLARDESGQADEYRMKDKVKHRKRTQQVAKQNQAKKRAEVRNKRKERRAARSADTSELPDFF